MTPDRKQGNLSRRDFLNLILIGSLAAAASRCEPLGIKLPSPEGTATNPTETVPPVTLPTTEISPSLGAGETIVIAEQRYMSQQEVLAIDPLVESKFREFQEEIKANNPSATFAAWGALATAQTGETYFTPFFEVYNDGNLISEYVNIGKIDGSIATIELKPGEVEGPDGKIYVSLSQTVNADTNELLETPWPYIWIPYSRAEYYALPDDQKDKVPVYFSAIPGIVPQNEAPVAYGGAKTENIRMIIATPTPETAEIVWDFNDPEVLPTKSFEYLTSTEFAQQVLDWEAQGKFPEVPDTAVPIKTIEIGLDTDTAFLKKVGFVSIYGFPEQSSNPVGYKGHLEKVPYILAGVWKMQYQGENAFFILKKWKNLDDSAGFEGYIYKTQSINPKAITWELIDYGFGNEIRYPTGKYFLNGTATSGINGFTNGCRLYFNQSGNPDSAFCTWYYGNPDLVFNKELYYRWQRTGILSNYITVNGEKVPFIPISPLTSLVFTPKQ